jgi:hypothetical protein
MGQFDGAIDPCLHGIVAAMPGCAPGQSRAVASVSRAYLQLRQRLRSRGFLSPPLADEGGGRRVDIDSPMTMPPTTIASSPDLRVGADAMMCVNNGAIATVAATGGGATTTSVDVVMLLLRRRPSMLLLRRRPSTSPPPPTVGMHPWFALQLMSRPH